MRFFKPDLSSLGGVFKAPKLGPRHDKMAAHVSESPTTVLLPKGYDDIVNCFFPVVHHSLCGSVFLKPEIKNDLDQAKCSFFFFFFLQKCSFVFFLLYFFSFFLFIA